MLVMPLIICAIGPIKLYILLILKLKKVNKKVYQAIDKKVNVKILMKKLM
jgi:hypothetical protein